MVLACMGGPITTEEEFRLTVVSNGTENSMLRRHPLLRFAKLNEIELVDEDSYARLCVLTVLQDVLVDDHDY